jgi:ubiquinol-cytochrome c reductase cytochrome c subunit
MPGTYDTGTNERGIRPRGPVGEFDARALGGLLALIAIAVVTLVAVGPAVARGAAADPPQRNAAQVRSLGTDLYVANCAACHGSGGHGTTDGPSLIGAGAASADFMLRTGRMPLAAPNAPMRPGPPAFDDEQIQALVAYIGGLGPGPAIPDMQVHGAADLPAGRTAYIANCAACHGAGATGDAVGGGNIAPRILDTAATQVGEAVRTGPGVMPAFSPDQIDDATLPRIAAYLTFLRDQASPGGVSPGGVGPVAEGYVAWLVYLAGFLLLARWIERRRHT